MNDFLSLFSTNPDARKKRRVVKLKKILSKKNKEKRYRAAKELISIGEKEGVDFFISIIVVKGGHYGEYNAHEEVGLLGESGEIAVNPLLNMLYNPREYVRVAAVTALGNIKDRRAIPSFINYLRDEGMGKVPVDGGYTSHAIKDALLKFGESALSPLMDVLKNDRVVRGVRNGTNYSSDLNYTLREIAVEIIGELRHKNAVDILINYLDDHYSNGTSTILLRGCYSIYPVAIKAAEALGKIGDIKAVDSLIEHFDNSSNYMRKEIVIALSQIGDIKGVPIYLKGIRSFEDDVRKYSLEALRNIDGNVNHGFNFRTLELISGLYSSGVNECLESIVELGELRDPRSVESLSDAYKVWSHLANAREKIKEALKKIGTAESLKILKELEK